MSIKKKVLSVLAGTAAVAASALPVLASESGGSLSTIETALQTSFTSVGTSITSVIGTILPIALPIIGAGILVFTGIKVFKRITNKV